MAENTLCKFLPDMKTLLDVDDLFVYLLSEQVVTTNDRPRLKISDQNPKNSVIVNLQEIIQERRGFDPFLKALKRSAEEHSGHRELLTMIENEQQGLKASQDPSPVSTVVAQGASCQINIETSVFLPDESTEVDSPVRNVHESVELQPLGHNLHDKSTYCQVPVQHHSTQTHANVVLSESQNFNPKTFFCGCCCTVWTLFLVLLLALVITIICYGVLGLLGREGCDFESKSVYVFNITSSLIALMLILLAVIMTIRWLLMKFKWCGIKVYRVILCHSAFIGIFLIICMFGNWSFSFSIADQVYGSYGTWKHGSINNCTSSTYYTAFTYLTLEYIFLGTISVFGCIYGFIYCVTCVLHTTLCPDRANPCAS